MATTDHFTADPGPAHQFSADPGDWKSSDNHQLVKRKLEAQYKRWQEYEQYRA